MWRRCVRSTEVSYIKRVAGRKHCLDTNMAHFTPHIAVLIVACAEHAVPREDTLGSTKTGCRLDRRCPQAANSGRHQPRAPVSSPRRLRRSKGVPFLTIETTFITPSASSSVIGNFLRSRIDA